MNLVQKRTRSRCPTAGQLWARHLQQTGGGFRVVLDLIDTAAAASTTNTVVHIVRTVLQYQRPVVSRSLDWPTARRKISKAHPAGRISVQSRSQTGHQFSLQFPVSPRLIDELPSAPTLSATTRQGGRSTTDDFFILIAGVHPHLIGGLNFPIAATHAFGNHGWNTDQHQDDSYF